MLSVAPAPLTKVYACVSSKLASVVLNAPSIDPIELFSIIILELIEISVGLTFDVSIVNIPGTYVNE